MLLDVGTDSNNIIIMTAAEVSVAVFIYAHDCVQLKLDTARRGEYEAKEPPPNRLD